MSPRILVTVSRTYTDISTMREVLEKAYAAHPDAVLVHGDCPRGDRLAAKLWRDLGGTDEPWPAKWNHRGAGLQRNAAMVESNPDLVIAFIRDNSRGATHCADLAEGAGIPTVRYTHEEAV